MGVTREMQNQMFRDYPDINTKVMKDRGLEINDLKVTVVKNNSVICDLEEESFAKTKLIKKERENFEAEKEIMN